MRDVDRVAHPSEERVNLLFHLRGKKTKQREGDSKEEITESLNAREILSGRGLPTNLMRAQEKLTVQAQLQQGRGKKSVPTEEALLTACRACGRPLADPK